jgi:uncharacterized protein YndB with AHSA1/START domain
MDTIDWTQFTRRIAVKAPLHKMYDAWTKELEIESWFLSKAEFHDSNGIDLESHTHVKKGDTYAWNWYLYPDTEYGRITEANGKDHLQFTFAGECLVDINLTEQAGHTIVELTQKNIPTDDLSKKNIRLGCDAGWSFYMVNLKSVYEGGHDLRNKNQDLMGMINM